MSEQFSNPEQALIERLRRAPQPELAADARELIRARILDVLDHPPVPAHRPTLLRPVVVMAIVLVVGALIAGGVLFVLSRQTQPEITPTPPATLTMPAPTVTPTITLTTTVTPTVTTQATQTLIPTASPSAIVGIISVVEGPVESVDGNVITIYGTPVQLPPNTTVSVGDVVRVESNSQTGTSQVIITAVPVVHATAAANPNPPSSDGWQDDGTCSHPPPDWAPANGWRRRCEGKEKPKDNNGKPKK